MLIKAFDLFRQTLPIIEQIARLTPTRSDDGIVALLKCYEVRVQVYLRTVRRDADGATGT